MGLVTCLLLYDSQIDTNCKDIASISLPLCNLFQNHSLGRVRGSLARAKLCRVPALAFEVRTEALILLGNGVLADCRQQGQGNDGRQHTEAGSDPEGILGRLGVVTAGLANEGKHPGADKGANLTDGGGDAIVATTDASGARLGGKEANIVARPDLAEGEEDAVDNGKGGDVLGDFGVDAGHDEADGGLRQDAKGESVLGANPVGDEGAEDGAGEVKHVDDGVPAKDLGKRGVFAVYAGEDGGGVDAECVDGELESQVRKGGDK